MCCRASKQLDSMHKAATVGHVQAFAARVAQQVVENVLRQQEEQHFCIVRSRLASLESTEHLWLDSINEKLTIGKLVRVSRPSKSIALMHAMEPSPREVMLCLEVKTELARAGVEVRSCRACIALTRLTSARADVHFLPREEPSCSIKAWLCTQTTPHRIETESARRYGARSTSLRLILQMATSTLDSLR